MAKSMKQKYVKSVDEGDLNDKQLLFVSEYIKDLDAKRAGLAAGYDSADSGHRQLAKPNVQRQIAVELSRLHKAKAITNELVLEQLHHALTRTSDDFMDPKTGRLVNDLRLLSDRAKNTIEGIEQKVETWTDGDGEQHVQVHTKLKFVSKQAAIDLAMRHKGLIEANKTGDVHVTVNLNDFLIGSTSEVPVDPVEQRIKMIENKADKFEKLAAEPVQKGKTPVASIKAAPKKPIYSAKELIDEE